MGFQSPLTGLPWKLRSTEHLCRATSTQVHGFLPGTDTWSGRPGLRDPWARATDLHSVGLSMEHERVRGGMYQPQTTHTSVRRDHHINSAFLGSQYFTEFSIRQLRPQHKPLPLGHKLSSGITTITQMGMIRHRAVISFSHDQVVPRFHQLHPAIQTGLPCRKRHQLSWAPGPVPQ